MAEERTITSQDDDELLSDDSRVQYAANFEDVPVRHGAAADTSEEESEEVHAAKARIEDTRSHMTDTIDAIKEKLSPAHLMEEAKDATIHKAQDMVSDAVDAVKTKASGIVEAVGDAYHAAADHVTEFAHSAADAITGVTHSATDAVSDAAHSAKDAVTGAAHNVADRVQTFRDDHTASASTPDRYELTTIGANREKTNIGATLMETIKLNPVPAAIAGFGLGWLLLSAQRQRATAIVVRDYDNDISTDPSYVTPAAAYRSNFGTAMNNPVPTDAPGLRDRASDLAHNIGDQASDIAHSVSDKASGLAQSVTDKASGIAQSVSDKASGIASTVSDRASDIKDRATDWAGTVRDNAGQFRDRAGDAVHNFAGQTKVQAGATVDSVDKFVHDQPLAAAAIALLLGAVVAYSLPSTQKENELLGPQRDRLVDQGKDAATDVAHKVQNVANVALGKAQQSLSQTVGQVKEQVQHTVQEAKETVVSEAQNQGLATATA